jgi:hypothetical protein
MSDDQARRRWRVGGGAIILLIVAVPLWDEFRVRGNPAWNAFLAAFLVGLAIAAILLQRHFLRHASEIGEARFDTSNDRPESQPRF